MWDKSPVGVCITQDKHPLKKEIPEYSIAKKGGELMNNYEYIKDAFTKEENQTNLEVNNLKAECITSKNSNFELDSSGNLTVKSIIAENVSSTSLAIDLLNSIYPIGSIYMSMNQTDPSILFGGTWERIQARFLIGAGTPQQNNTVDLGVISTNELGWDFVAGNTGGEFEHQLTIEEIASHNHNFQVNIQHIDGAITSGESLMTGLQLNGRRRYVDTTHTEGQSQRHNNVPPYLAVYMWKRTN